MTKIPLEIKTVNNIANHPLQTWQWGKFRESWGNTVAQGSYGQIIYSKIPFTKYKIGTLIRSKMPDENAIKNIRKNALAENALFVKLEPDCNNKNLSPGDFDNSVKFLSKHARPGKNLFTPETFWIDLTKKEDELMKSFTPKTRYNIRLAERKGVEIKEDNSDKAFEKYLSLTFETANRQGFYAHTENYHKLMWKHLHTDMIKNSLQPIARLLVASYQGEIISAWILFVWKKLLYYPYGASSNQNRNVMANNLMLWEAIKLGKRRGLLMFDLWGKEEGKGFTKFKEGYNPEVVKFVGSWDIVVKPPQYLLYRIAEKVRWFFLKKILPHLR